MHAILTQVRVKLQKEVEVDASGVHGARDPHGGVESTRGCQAYLRRGDVECSEDPLRLLAGVPLAYRSLEEPRGERRLEGEGRERARGDPEGLAADSKPCAWCATSVRRRERDTHGARLWPAAMTQRSCSRPRGWAWVVEGNQFAKVKGIKRCVRLWGGLRDRVSGRVQRDLITR